MLTLQNLTYIHSNNDLLFDNINLTIKKQDKIALIGNNGSGKSTLLKVIAGLLKPSNGSVQSESLPYYLPQHFGQYNNLTVAQALHVGDKLRALYEILEGLVTDSNMTVLADDWTIEERCLEAMSYWGIENIDLHQKLNILSGGEKTKIFLAGIAIHDPEIVLMDEPSNHLDVSGRALLYDWIKSYNKALIVVSHDRKLLKLIDTVCELNGSNVTTYGGSYDFYMEQKAIENNALSQDIKSKEKALRKAREVEREAAERQQKLDARGKKKQEKAGLPTISMKTFKNNAEKSTARMKDVHSEKVGSISQELNELRKELPEIDKMKFDFDNSSLHSGKILVNANGINHSYNKQSLWKDSLTFQIRSGERVVIKGKNGAGKTTLIKFIMGTLQPDLGVMERADNKSIYIDQEYSLIHDLHTIYEQAQEYNVNKLEEHEIKIRLNRFLFTKDYWDKPCAVLSGGERMRLLLCCLTISNKAPDIIILDEPTNNLDIQNIEILTTAINEYKGTLIIVSHDEIFLEQIKIERTIELR